MRITPVGTAELAFTQENMTALLAEGAGYRSLPPFGNEAAAVRVTGSDLILRWEDAATMPALPQNELALVHELNGWYEQELSKLSGVGIGIEPHASFVLVNNIHEPPVIATVTRYASTQVPVFTPEKPKATRSPDPRKQLVAAKLALSLHDYFLNHQNSAETATSTILGIDDPARYYGGELSESGFVETLPTLHRFPHVRATGSDAIHALENVRRWERVAATDGI